MNKRSVNPEAVTLNNGVQMPTIGLGVFQASPAETVGAVVAAFEEGYRLIDTASAYHNEDGVGEGIRQSGVTRSEIFVTTKLWLRDYGYDETLRAFDKSLSRLGLDYLDLYLLHWATRDFDATVQSFEAAKRLLADGRVRAIGVCNHTIEHLDELIARTGFVPAVNQVELHPYLSQPDLCVKHKALGIVTEAWAPIGGIHRYTPGSPVPGGTDLLDHPVIKEAAHANNKTAAQVILRWHHQHGVVAIPKSVKASRIAENIDIFDFHLSDEQMVAIDGLNVGGRGGPDPSDIDTHSFAQFD
ncbi:aldo/keto reductase [Paraburkholderia sp. EG286B]|uniref:aldo/keto reductase n=1 Tax=Paraburkholderia sp. EG286B TaxID=3237011 RepID=UPI0034D24E0E